MGYITKGNEMTEIRILKSEEGTKAEGYVYKTRHGARWEVWDDKGLADCGWEPTEERATKECRKSWKEVVEPEMAAA